MIAFDTNVLIYACDRSNPARQTKAQGLIASEKDGVLVWQVACEFVAASRKLARQGFGAVDAWQRLSEFAGVMALVPPTHGILERGRALHVDRKLPFWDSMIYAACQEAGVSRLYSEDRPGLEIPGLEIINPFAA